MKAIFALCGIILVAGGIFAYRALQGPNEFGSFSQPPKAEVKDLIERPRDFLSKTVTIEGVVKKQCTTMGCYFFFEEGDKMLRVDISEIAMHAPRRNGRVALVEGQIVPYQDGYQFWASAVRFK